MPAKKRARTFGAKGRIAKRAQPKRDVPATLRSHKVEVKTVDAINGGSPPYLVQFTSTGNFNLLNGLAPGTGINQRVGRKIALKSLRIQGSIFQSQAGTVPGNDFCRFIVLYDRQPNAAAPALSDVLQSVDAAGNTSSSVWDGLNPSNYERFKILRDKRFKFDNGGATTNPFLVSMMGQNMPQETVIDEFIPLKDLETHYNAGTAGTIADITTGSIYTLCLGTKSAANAQFAAYWTSRIRFLDL